MILTYRSLVPLVLVLILVLSPLAFVGAHAGEEHSTEAETKAHEQKTAYTMTEAQMEQVIALLRQVLSLMVEKKRVANITIPAPVAPVHTEAKTDEHDEDEDGHVHDMATSSPVASKQLIIEVEDHFGKTHVHIRYTDKPEDMYFADVAKTDEAGLIANIKARSGLSEDAIKAALKFL